MKSHLFYYDLPKRYIAQRPLKTRDSSKLLVMDRKSGAIKHDYFNNLKKYLDQDILLVINKSKVNRCRVFTKKEDYKKNIECFILNNIKGDQYLGLIRPSKKVKEGDILRAGRHDIKILEKLDKGKAILNIESDIDELYSEHGNIPLPPYIKTDDIKEEEYQTVFAREGGSTAAPTAGLHFTDKLLKDLKDSGIEIAEVLLHIGLDTFRPITEDEIEKHRMHSEYFSIDQSQAKKIEYAKKSSKKIVAVGTTTTRVLETIYGKESYYKEGSGHTDLYIKPGYKFKAIDGMITNFHLPKSTLLVMVSAFAGRENIFNAYRIAKEKGYRFFSFGDAMLIL